MSTIGPSSGLQQVITLRQQMLESSKALQSLRDGGKAEQAPSSKTDSSFAETLQGAVEQVNASQTQAGEVSAAYERGEVTNVAQVMLARQEAGLAFEATLQVRNKLLTAYQDIMRLGV